MNKPELTALMKSVGTIVREYTAAAIVGVVQRLETLEKTIKEIPTGPRGEKGEPGESIVGPAGPKGEDAPPVDLDTVVLKVLEMVPAPKDGNDGLSVDHAKVVADVLVQIPVPRNGESIKGDAGKDGSSILVGDGPPLSAGNSGDVYLDSKTGDIYRCA